MIRYAMAGLGWLKPMAACLLLALAGCVSQAGGSAVGWQNGKNGVPPRADRVYICHGFGCAYKTPVSLSSAKLRKLRIILASGRKNAAAERAAIARAVQWQEKLVAAEVGSAGDIGGLDMRNAGVKGQRDCIDEATNTTSVLMIAQTNGYLKHHTVASPVARGFFLDGRYPHATAAVREQRLGRTMRLIPGRDPKASRPMSWPCPYGWPNRPADSLGRRPG